MPYKTWLMFGGAVALIVLGLTPVEAKVVTQTVDVPARRHGNAGLPGLR